MTTTDQRRSPWRLRRGIVLRLPRAAGITVGKPGRQLRIGRRSLTIRLGQSALGLTISWRRSWQRLWNDISCWRHGSARSRDRRRS